MRERINCACVKLPTTIGVIPVRHDQLFMDVVNDLLREGISPTIDYFFITNTGRVVDRFEGWKIALEANQLPDAQRRAGKELEPLDLWNIKGV